MTRPACHKCGREMTPETARLRPELFYHDECLPPEYRPSRPAPPAVDPTPDALDAAFGDGFQAAINLIAPGYFGREHVLSLIAQAAREWRKRRGAK